MTQDNTPASNKQPKKPRLVTWDKVSADNNATSPSQQSIDWNARSGAGRGLLRKTERLALLVKEPIDRLVGTTQLNPLYYSGTIGFFLLAVVVITGVYVLMFYQYGFDVSYGSIQGMDRFIVSRAARAVHRYASGGLLIFGMLHAIRMFFMDRFRGPRWLGWTAGVATIAIIWLAGVTGYWLLWDQGAQLITQAFVNLLSVVPGWATAFYFSFLEETAARQNSWLLVLLITLVHILVTIVAGVFYWLHIKRLSRPRFFPPRYWIVGMTALLIIAAVFFPANLLPNADLTTLPQTTPLDPLYLFYLPFSLNGSAAAVWVSAILLGITVLVAAVPWLFPKQKLTPVAITPERCTGCTHCVQDCPYGALRMIPRSDDTPFAELAVVDPKLCVSCGICVGSCDTLAISLGENKPELLWQDVAARLENRKNLDRPVKVVFTCERHAAHGAHTYATSELSGAAGTSSAVEVVPVTCVAMVNPGVMTHALEAGAAEVQVVGCPPNDCTNREGNMWTEERLRQMRAPKLKPKFKDAPIFTTWLAPDHFADAIPLHATGNTPPVHPDQIHPPTTFEQIMAMFNRRNLIIAVILLAVGLLLQVQITYTTYHPAAGNQAIIQLVIHESPEGLQVTVDGKLALQTGPGSIYEQIPTTAGPHQVQIAPAGSPTDFLVDETVTLEQGQVLHLALDTRRLN